VERNATLQNTGRSDDLTGKLGWPEGDLDGDHLVCVVSEQVSEDYLAMLREKGISYIASCPPQKIGSHDFGQSLKGFVA
jgi:hypothetical protein